MLRIAPELRLADGVAVTSAPEYWRPLRRQLGDAEFLRSIAEFDRMQVKLLTIKKLQVTSDAAG